MPYQYSNEEIFPLESILQREGDASSHHVVERWLQAMEETVPRAILALAPSHLGKCQGSRICLVVDALRGVDALAPKSSCHTEEVVLLKFVAHATAWVEVVGVLEGGGWHTPVDLRHVALSHRIVEIAVLARTKHDAGIVADGCVEGFFRQADTPSEGDTVRLNLLEVGLIPEHRCLVVLRLEHINDVVEEIALQSPVLGTIGGGDTLLLLQCLALRTGGPTVECRIASLIATQVDIRRREYISQLLEYIAQELVGELVARTEKFV